jgi:hypothetical protein
MFSPLWQGQLPPLPTGAGIDWGNLMLNMGLAVLWTVVAVISFAIAIPVAMRLFNALTPGLDEMEELEKGNMAVALVYAFFIVSATAVIVAVLLK